MINIAEEFTEFKADLQEKWLDYCENNMELIDVFYPNGNYLDSAFILGVLSVLESKINQWIQFYCTHLNQKSSAHDLIIFFDLHFDYQKALEARKEERQKNQLIEPPSPLDDFRKKIIE